MIILQLLIWMRVIKRLAIQSAYHMHTYAYIILSHCVCNLYDAYEVPVADWPRKYRHEFLNFNYLSHLTLPLSLLVPPIHRNLPRLLSI